MSMGMLRQSVRDVLSMRENRLVLIESQLLLLIFVALYVTLSQTFFAMQMIPAIHLNVALTYLLFAMYAVLLVVFSVFLVLPSVVGFMRLAVRMEQGEDVMPAELFSVFSDKRLYRLALWLSWRGFWRVAVTVTVVRFTIAVSTYFFAGNLLAGVVCGVIVVLELIGGIFLILRGFSLLADALFSECTVKQAMATMPRGAVGAATHFLWGFLPWLLLCILTFGILLLWEVLPCMAIAYFRYCRALNDQNLNIHSEEYINE
jgi:hypothetical protein